MPESDLLAAEIAELDDLTVEDLLIGESTDVSPEMRGACCSWCGC